MDGVGDLAIEDRIGLITICSPPVNSLSIPVRRALVDGLRRFTCDDAVTAIILICAGRTFFAGAEITEIGRPPVAPSFQDIFDLIEAGTKPVIAAIHGTALGGGYELALACHYRIAVPSAQIGLPEVHLGLLPGGGGTQRLPRAVGPEVALDIIVKGAPVRADKALGLGMIDALAEEGKLREGAVAFARTVRASGEPHKRVRDRQDKVESARARPEIFAEFRTANSRAMRGLKAPENIVKAIEAAVALPFDQGMLRERALFQELLDSSESAAQRYYFFAEREAGKVPGLPKETPRLPIKSVGVIGAGTMGGGIAMNFVNAGIPVTLVEMDQAALDRGVGVIRRNYDTSAAKRRIPRQEVQDRMALIRPRLGLEALADVDLVIEAAFEEIAVKIDIFTRLDAIARPGAILASNTSFLDLDAIAAATQRPEWVIGLHFFSPANVMRLLEVVRGAKTSNEVIATAMALTKAIGKVAVLARVGHGFIANRVMSQCSGVAANLLLRGQSAQDIDAALYHYGFPMGPFQMMDLVGLDVIGRNDSERSVRGDLVALGRLGQKSNGGYYDYDEKRNATASPVATKVIADFAAFKGIRDGLSLSSQDLVARLLYPVVNEGARVLDEGIAIRASDIDVACILGYNWPVYTGGPMFWADTVGLPEIVRALQGIGIEPARLLVEKAASGGGFTR